MESNNKILMEEGLMTFDRVTAIKPGISTEDMIELIGQPQSIIDAELAFRGLTFKGGGASVWARDKKFWQYETPAGPIQVLVKDELTVLEARIPPEIIEILG